MEAQTLSILISAIVGILLGAGLVWFLSRSANESAVEAATIRVQGESQAAVAELRERCRAYEESTVQAARDFGALKTQFDSQRKELDAASNEVSRLGERASRVEDLERRVAKVSEDLRLQSEELRRISAQASQSATQAQSEGERAIKLQSHLEDALSKLQLADDKVNLLTGQNATLEERANRAEELERNLAKATEDHRLQSKELRRVSAQASQSATRAQSEGERATKLQLQLEDALSKLQLADDKVNLLTGQNATLEERANRAEELERSLAKATEDHRLQSEELRRVSALASQSTTQAQSEGARASKLQSQLEDALSKLELADEKVNLLTGQNATLEEQVSRVSPLEREFSQERDRHGETQRQLSALKTSSGAEISRLQAELNADRESLTAVRADLVDEKKARSEADAAVTSLTAQVSKLSTQLQAELQASQEKLALLEEAKNTLSEQFKNVANDLLEEKSKKFAEQNQTNLGQLLDPLRVQINEFKGKVEEVYVQESKDRSAMAEQVRQLVSLNQALSQEAKNLTNALKGNTKAQGNWGELILERVLEASGLIKGHEYIVQDSQKREDGSRAQPDMVILLPEKRKLVVDSKVSLIAYEEYTVADSDEERALAMRRHLDSVRKHVAGLSIKEYDKLYGGGLDFVLMFVPIEPAFMLAISQDDRLFMESWERNVLLVSPSTLLFVVRTVAHLWRQEQQSRNAQDIAKRGAELYDKLVDFVKDLTHVGNRLKLAQESYDEAYKRLATGKGNVIRQAEMLRELGVKANKKLPSELIEESRSTLTVVEEMAALAAQNTPREGTSSNSADMSDVGAA